MLNVLANLGQNALEGNPGAGLDAVASALGDLQGWDNVVRGLEVLEKTLDGMGLFDNLDVSPNDRVQQKVAGMSPPPHDAHYRTAVGMAKALNALGLALRISVRAGVWPTELAPGQLSDRMQVLEAKVSQLLGTTAKPEDATKNLDPMIAATNEVIKERDDDRKKAADAKTLDGTDGAK